MSNLSIFTSLVQFDDHRRIYPHVTEPDRGWPFFFCILALTVEALVWFRYDVPGGGASIVFETIGGALIIGTIFSLFHLAFGKDNRNQVLVRYAMCDEGQALLSEGDRLGQDAQDMYDTVNNSTRLIEKFSPDAKKNWFLELEEIKHGLIVRSIELNRSQTALKERIRLNLQYESEDSTPL